MKKIMYSGVTKALAVLLFIASLVSGVLIVTNGVTQSAQTHPFVYRFEDSFSESSHLWNLLEMPQHAVIDAYYNTTHTESVSLDEHGSSYEQTTTSPTTDIPDTNAGEPELESVESPPLTDHNSSVDPVLFCSYLEEALEVAYYSDKIDYFIDWNGTVFTNCDATDAQVLQRGDFYTCIQINTEGEITLDSSTSGNAYILLDYIREYDMGSSITVCASIREAYENQCRVAWESQEALVMNTFFHALILATVALLLLIYLICVCGKGKNGEQKILWVDYIWTEIHLAAMIGIAVGAAALYLWMLEEHLYRHFPIKLLLPATGILATLTSAAVLTSLLSIIRSIKGRRGIASSLILSMIRWIIILTVKVLKWFYRACRTCKHTMIRVLSKKTGVLLITMLLVYTLVIGFGFFAYFIDEAFWIFWLLISFLFFAVACWVLARRAADLDEIKKGVREVRGGSVTYKIPEPTSQDLKPLAQDINDIAQGLDEAVSAKLKAEQLKSQLITNVSHDLKTPLTSIISYTELLSQVEGLPEEAQDYVQVIATKSQRLKNLTQDLFDISKVQSGNEEILLEKLDVAVLIEQSLGEHDGEIRSSAIPFCVDVPKNLYISADGRKISRVVSNLINNILKYSMKNTRVFITAEEKNGEIILEFKNIASYPMNFKADEIVGRFVRGDESRTAPGSGLGLAIAKSYTEACGGRFEIRLDGDLFKALVIFPTYSSDSE